MNYLIRTLVAYVLVCTVVHAIKDESNQNRWQKPCDVGPDAVVPGFLVNMGPTGARGILKAQSFVVKYIFPSSPASGVLKINDEVIGANGKRFATHTFGGSSATGIVGPIQDMGLAIEDSEGRDGLLRLTVKRSGSTQEMTIRLEKLGRFADTFPEDCQKTKVLKKRAYAYLMKHHDGMSSQGRCVTILAMLSADDSKVVAEGKRLAREWNRIPGKDTWSWHLGFQGITLGEYYLLTQDRSVLPTLEALSTLLRAAQFKGPNIHKWKAKEGESQALIDEHTQLYEGGFGHAPFYNKPGGYGPMQRPTYLAILAWQLMQRCGIKLKHPGLEQAFKFVNYGTNRAGLTAYGGEFTLNNGPIDPARWRSSTRNGCSHKSGMAYLLYKLSPERKESTARMKLHLSNIDVAYRDMPDGHACPMMGLVWGWAGVYASQDTALKKKITNYYKAWINMARCHGSDSYVILPGRNYADGSYYRGNIRNHTTGSIAFLYSFSSPKLQVQGVDVSIPGVNHLVLSGTAANAYKAIAAKEYGRAGKMLKGSKSAQAGKMLDFINQRSQAVISELQPMLDRGEWYTLRLKMKKARTIYGGVPIVDQSIVKWTKLMSSKPGKALISADRDADKGLIGKACARIDSIVSSDAGPEYTKPAATRKQLLDREIDAFQMKLKVMYSNGEWSTLKKVIGKEREKYTGVKRFDELDQKLQKILSSQKALTLIAAHDLVLKKAYGQAAAATKKLASQENTKGFKHALGQLSNTIDRNVQDYVSQCEEMLNKGEWYSLKKELSRSKSKMAGAPLFDSNYKKWGALLASDPGRQIMRVNKYIHSGEIGSAAKSLKSAKKSGANGKTGTAIGLLGAHIEKLCQEQLAPLAAYEQAGDWYTLSKELDKAARVLGGAESFDQKEAAWRKKMQEKDIKRIISAGRQYNGLAKRWKYSKSSRLRKQIASFAEKNGETFYGKQAKALIQ